MVATLAPEVSEVHADDDDTPSERSTIMFSFPDGSLPFNPVNAARRPPLVSPDELVVTVGDNPDPVRKVNASLSYPPDIVTDRLYG